MKLGQRITDRTTGKKGEVVHVYSHRVTVRFEDGTLKTMRQTKAKVHSGRPRSRPKVGELVWIQINGVAHPLKGEMVAPGKAIVTEDVSTFEGKVWHGCEVTCKEGSFVLRAA